MRCDYYVMSGYSTTSPYAAISNGRVHYSAASALPLTLLSTTTCHHQRDVGAYTPDAMTLSHDLTSPRCTPNSGDHSTPVQLPRSRLQFIRSLGHGLLGDVSIRSTAGGSISWKGACRARYRYSMKKVWGLNPQREPRAEPLVRGMRGRNLTIEAVNASTLLFAVFPLKYFCLFGISLLCPHAAPKRNVVALAVDMTGRGHG